MRRTVAVLAAAAVALGLLAGCGSSKDDDGNPLVSGVSTSDPTAYARTPHADADFASELLHRDWALLDIQRPFCPILHCQTC